MGPYYDAVSLMIWRVPEPRQTPWAGFRETGQRPAPPSRRPRLVERLLGRARHQPLRSVIQRP